MKGLNGRPRGVEVLWGTREPQKNEEPLSEALVSHLGNNLLHWSQHAAGHRPGQDLPTCSSCLMVFSCCLWIFSRSRALDSSFQSLSFKAAMQFSPREGDPSSSCFWACSISTSCFSCKVSCSFRYRDKVGRDLKSHDRTPAPPGTPLQPAGGRFPLFSARHLHCHLRLDLAAPRRAPCGTPRAPPWDSSYRLGWGVCGKQHPCP